MYLFYEFFKVILLSATPYIFAALFTYNKIPRAPIVLNSRKFMLHGKYPILSHKTNKTRVSNKVKNTD